MLTSLIVLRVNIVTMYQTYAMLETVGPGLNGVLTRLVVAPTQMVDAVVTLTEIRIGCGKRMVAECAQEYRTVLSPIQGYVREYLTTPNQKAQ